MSTQTASSPSARRALMFMILLCAVLAGIVLLTEPQHVQIIVGTAYILGAMMGAVVYQYAYPARGGTGTVISPTSRSSKIQTVVGYVSQEDRLYDALIEMGYKPGQARRAAVYASRQNMIWDEAIQVAQSWVEKG